LVGGLGASKPTFWKKSSLVSWWRLTIDDGVL